MTLSQKSVAAQTMPQAPAPAYNGGSMTLQAGNNTVSVIIGALGTSASSLINGIYHVYRATVTSGTVGAYAELGTVQSQGSSGGYQQVTYNDNTALNGTTYSYCLAVENN